MNCMNIEEAIYDNIIDRTNNHIFFQLMDFEHNNILFSSSVEMSKGVTQHSNSIGPIIKSTIETFLNNHVRKITN